MTDTDQERLLDALMDGDTAVGEEIAQAALDAGASPLDVINKLLIPALTEIGAMFQQGEIFLPELMLSGQVATAISQKLEALIHAGGQVTQSLGTVVVGTVQGDIHDIGKNILATMLRAHGFEVVDLGRSVSPSAFVDAAQEHHAQVVAMSSLMTTTRPMMLNTLKLFGELGLRPTYRLIVGGGCVTADWAQQIGADGYAADAATAVDVCKQMVAA
jgi:5-methyltetrahydrofolate--homocysteine methyltransferase